MTRLRRRRPSLSAGVRASECSCNRTGLPNWSSEKLSSSMRHFRWRTTAAVVIVGPASSLSRCAMSTSGGWSRAAMRKYRAASQHLPLVVSRGWRHGAFPCSGACSGAGHRQTSACPVARPAVGQRLMSPYPPGRVVDRIVRGCLLILDTHYSAVLQRTPSRHSGSPTWVTDQSGGRVRFTNASYSDIRLLYDGV